MTFAREDHDTLASTNDRALALARTGADRVAVTARTQHEGRGRRGNRWSSPEDAGLYVSFLVRPRVSAVRSPLLTLACGVAVHDAFAPVLNAPIGLKWPNDVLAAGPGPNGGRKLAGILVESATAGQHLDYAVLGIGLNLRAASHPDPDAARRAISVAELGASLGRTEAYDRLASTVGALVDRIQSDGLDFVPAAWEARALGLNRTVTVRVGDRAQAGTLLGLASDGGLRLSSTAGEEIIYTGELDPDSLIGA
jgi:BirA family biotin operon repressor/biotin-[acetyl-CoA-carboxylase] ligase